MSSGVLLLVDASRLHQVLAAQLWMLLWKAKEFFQEKDYLDHRYHVKRMAYLQVLQQHLESAMPAQYIPLIMRTFENLVSCQGEETGRRMSSCAPHDPSSHIPVCPFASRESKSSELGDPE